MVNAGLIEYRKYADCIKIENDNTRVVLLPHFGGQVFEYSLNGINVINRNPKTDGWVYKGKSVKEPWSGRFDIGPEMVIPRHPNLWYGKWKGEIISNSSARMVSVKDKETGVQLIREFNLHKNSSCLSCKQIIKNISTETKEWCHWSRTLAVSKGICVVPLNPRSRFPKGYIMYENNIKAMNYNPEKEPNVRVRNGFLEITGVPSRPKFGIDSYAGWLSYLMKNNILFAKKFPVYPGKVYNEMAAITISIYYTDEICELEPIGPKTCIEPGESVSFTEDWWLFGYKYPKDRDVDLQAMQKFINNNCQ